MLKTRFDKITKITPETTPGFANHHIKEARRKAPQTRQNCGECAQRHDGTKFQNSSGNDPLNSGINQYRKRGRAMV